MKSYLQISAGHRGGEIIESDAVEGEEFTDGNEIYRAAGHQAVFCRLVNVPDEAAIARARLNEWVAIGKGLQDGFEALGEASKSAADREAAAREADLRERLAALQAQGDAEARAQAAEAELAALKAKIASETKLHCPSSSPSLDRSRRRLRRPA